VSTPLGLSALATAQIACYLVAVAPLVWLAARELKLDFSLAALSRVRAGQ
jgi:hypothetical protein